MNTLSSYNVVTLLLLTKKLNNIENYMIILTIKRNNHNGYLS